jgi:hypothetical protein
MKRSIFTLAVTLALGIALGAGMTSFVNAMQHVKVQELYKANLVTRAGRDASVFLAELGPGANMGKHYHPGEQAQEHLTTATTMYREMDMRFWLEQAEGAVSRL